ncbi:exodeoxyribonuclease V subunit alpha ['Osedax' symbiont bacterium Rs2_46_30_T18]|nr:exodeoxyribonuclease V subunit alpha ['Osedax' symbiont bacterium Rs2_46_30_T18]
MSSENTLQQLLIELQQQQFIRVIDLKFAQWLGLQLPRSSQTQLLLSAILSCELGDGHVCIELDNLQQIIAHWPDPLKVVAQRLLLAESVSNSALSDQLLIGDGCKLTPLVIDNRRLYLYRYWQYECKVAAKLLAPPTQSSQPLDITFLKTQLDKYFSSAEQPDWQRVAAAITTSHPISIISGGPGTGKTTTVTKLLAIYVESQLLAGRRPLIQLAAPTGKAAARLSESIAGAKQKLQLCAEVTALIPEQGQTLHRLLGTRMNSKKFIHNSDNPLLLDLLVIDEASMIDLPMMASIVDALSNQTRLVLIGDRDQLASVEAGSVLGDICAVPQLACYSKAQSEMLAQSCGFANRQYSPLAFSDRLAFLQKSYRFSAESGIGALASACNNGDVEAVEEVLCANYSDIQVLIPTSRAEDRLENILTGYCDYINLMESKCSDADQLLQTFSQFQVLCALRVGDFGVEKINLQLEQYFEKAAIKEPDNRWYIGRPIMVTRNDKQMRLYNGDIGIACIDQHSGQLKVWFEQGGELRAVLPSRLPQHETVFAMTVHKSQGSEFEHVMLLLAQSAKVINRELIYTAITRAKLRFSFFGLVQLLKQSVSRTTQRTSGLADKIWHTREL